MWNGASCTCASWRRELRNVPVRPPRIRFEPNPTVRAEDHALHHTDSMHLPLPLRVSVDSLPSLSPLVLLGRVSLSNPNPFGFKPRFDRGCVGFVSLWPWSSTFWQSASTTHCSVATNQHCKSTTMVMCCIGPVCFPLWQLLPVLVALLHQKGYLQWFRKEWVTLTWYKMLFQRAWGTNTEANTRLEAEATPGTCTDQTCESQKKK